MKTKINLRRSFLICLIFLLFCSLLSCASGGGGEGGGGGGRTTGTAVRLIHSGIDIAPLEMQVGAEYLQKMGFGDLSQYVKVSEGQISIALQRANSPGNIFRTINETLASSTEYTVFVFGSIERSTSSAVLLPDPVVRPEAGFARVQLLNGVDGIGKLTMKAPGAEALDALFGGSSGYVTLPMGPQVIPIVNQKGHTVATFNVVLEDRGEASLVLEGSDDLGVVFQRVFTDLD
jgi:Domain of unknown function (DUF4397)